MQGLVDFLLLDILASVWGTGGGLGGGPCFWPSVLLLSYFLSSQRGCTKSDVIGQNYSPVSFKRCIKKKKKGEIQQKKKKSTVQVQDCQPADTHNNNSQRDFNSDGGVSIFKKDFILKRWT